MSWSKLKYYIKHIRYFLEAIIALLIMSICFIVPYRLSGIIFRTIGTLIFYGLKICNTNRYQIAKKNLSLSFNNLNDKQINNIIMHNCQNMANFLSDFVYLPKVNASFLKKYVNPNNFNIIKESQDTGRPIIFLLCHLGNWEILHRQYFYTFGHKISIIYRPLNNPMIEWLHLKFRGVNHISKHDSTAIIKCVKQRNPLAVLADQRNYEGTKLMFFDRPAQTSLAMQKIAIKYDAIILPIRSIRSTDKPYKFEIKIEEAIDTRDYKDAQELTQKTLQIQEEWIRQYPDQWIWMYNRWKIKNTSL